MHESEYTGNTSTSGSIYSYTTSPVFKKVTTEIFDSKGNIVKRVVEEFYQDYNKPPYAVTFNS